MDSTPEQGPLSGRDINFDFGTWEIGKIISRKYREQEDPQGGSTLECHEVYEASAKDHPSKQAIIKTKKQIADWDDSDYDEPSEEIHREINNLSDLEDCRATPKLLGSVIYTQRPDEELPAGYVAYIVMEKVPGEDLENFDTFTREEQDHALWEFGSYHYTHWDPRRENIVWGPSSGQCFIVDLEDAEKFPSLTKRDTCLDSFAALESWGLIKGLHDGKLFFEKDRLLEDLKARLDSQEPPKMAGELQYTIFRKGEGK
ncbi:hypothetical protein BO94DRAFT_547448 [Aspergillus sclerotioniger CBS 115572]|uniref:Protein kinase domain-containing protein n=1 Tax=Aspergillus sclerotioniger CBS 115572 TaxID=1450535 RepID=A0A317WEZ1_9EURO|nr:hypothetical protein BO94DRAFT_547448 [Aspergillus sclerotioniger CBS 115572]PWY83797.1 hypothetical protein BO94DRAFT_547448 [Aspergillus sclerotioniger CBS 115572]